MQTIHKILFFSFAALFLFESCGGGGGGGGGVGPNPPDTSIVGDFTFVPSGEFRMGSNVQPYESDETPLHTVMLSPYYISLYEVTNEEYSAFLNDTSGGAEHWDDRMEIIMEGVRYRAEIGLGKYPVRYVTWDDAKAYAEFIGGRLPTEAEWEKAARGSQDTRIFPWGNRIFSGQANYYNTSGLWEVGTATGRSPYGCYDMAGNLWEWTADWYDQYYYQDSPYKDPQGPQTGTLKVIRGGGYMEQDYLKLRCSDRFYTVPEGRFPDLGFRCVIDSADFENRRQ